MTGTDDKKSTKSRLVSLAMVGAVAGSVGEDLFERVPMSILVGVAVVMIGGIVLAVRSRAAFTRNTDSTFLALVVAVASAVGAVIGGRLVDPLSREGKLAVFFAIMALVAGILVYAWRTRRSGAGAGAGTAR